MADEMIAKLQREKEEVRDIGLKLGTRLRTSMEECTALRVRQQCPNLVYPECRSKRIPLPTSNGNLTVVLC